MAMEECGFHVDRVGMMNEVYSDDAAMEMVVEGSSLATVSKSLARDASLVRCIIASVGVVLPVLVLVLVARPFSRLPLGF